MQDTLARRLRVLRAERGLTLRDAEHLTGVDKDTLSKIERGVRHPQDVTLAKIAKGYGVPVAELLEEPVLAGKAEAPEVWTGPLARYDPETWRRRLAYYRGVLEIHLQGWEEAAATLRTRKVPFHEGWARTVRQAAADDWNWLKENDLPEDLKTLLEVAEAGDELPQPVREEAARLTRALERLGEIPRLVTEAEREALRDRSEGEPGNVRNLLEEREKKSREGIPPGAMLSKVFEDRREIS
ncbi:MAG: helix-turn-helix domain-containing protein [Actinomycetota bacterium]|nr:helix-turn-helix domain-containing protein [Actinomycetota bacterium]